MKRYFAALAALAALAVSLPMPTFAQRGEAVAFNDFTTNAPGVKVTAQTFSSSRRGEDHDGSPTASPRVIASDKPGPRPNMCTGLVSGTEFVAYNDSPVCGSFAAPRPPRAGPANAISPPRLTPEDVALALMDEAVALAPQARLRIDPARVGLTGLDTYFWTRAPRPIQVSATIPGFTVTAEARPVQYVWDFGEGIRRTTTHPGRGWTRRRPGNIAHLYESLGTYRVGIEIIWAARWRANGGAWRDLGYFSTTDARDYPVREMVGLLVEPR